MLHWVDPVPTEVLALDAIIAALVAALVLWGLPQFADLVVDLLSRH